MEPAAVTGLVNGGFESALSNWTPSGTVRADTTAGLSHGGSGHAVLQPAYPTPARISQQVMVPTTATTLRFYYRIFGGMRTDHRSYKRLVKDMEALGLRVNNPSWAPYMMGHRMYRVFESILPGSRKPEDVRAS